MPHGSRCSSTYQGLTCFRLLDKPKSPRISCHHVIIDNWEYKGVTLTFHPLRGKHSGKSLARLVVQTLSEYNISSQPLALAADNAKNNGHLRKELERELRRRGITWNHDAGTVRCMARVIHLAVTQFLRVLKPVARNEFQLQYIC
jgi:hypothetical protein